MVDKLIAILCMALLGTIVLYGVIHILSKDKQDKKLEEDMAKFEANLKTDIKEAPTNREQNAIVTLSDIKNLSE